MLPTPILMQIYGEKIVMADDSAIGTILMVKTKGDDKSVADYFIKKRAFSNIGITCDCYRNIM